MVVSIKRPYYAHDLLFIIVDTCDKHSHVHLPSTTLSTRPDPLI